MTNPEQPWHASLTVRGVDVTLGGQPILRGVDLDVVPGEVLALVGPNGAGKSTLLAVMAGDLAPETGSVEIAGQSVHAMPAGVLAQHRGVLQQRQSLAFGFRAREVVEMGRAMWRRTERADADDVVVDRSMAVADVTHLSDRVVPTLSGGEQARVSFARLLAQETEVQFLDEPTAALDIKHQEAVLAQARASADAGAAVVVVLHDLSLAAAWAHRVCVLSAGRLRAVGTPAEVITSELLTEVYEHPVHVISHEGNLLVVPVRGAATPAVPEEASWSAQS
ncbi:MAG: heme ABC transporter ATP-binding protein [Nocardioides sp.]|uniref:heme ABC transporter ATP-binding protein n=1 Tax=Nocardioides sp. TaxID=35761 RepID=UPI003F07C03C